MSSLEDFSEITRRNEPLGPLTWLKVGGPAEYFVEPRDPDELQRVVLCCRDHGIPVRLLGSGSNLLVSDEGVSGVVIRVTGDAFSTITIDGTRVSAGGAAALSAVVSQSVGAGLTGLEVLAGIPGTVGGAIHGNAGGREGDVGQHVSAVSVLTVTGERFTRTEDELVFSYRRSSVDELVVLECSFDLQLDEPDAITRRMRKIWIKRKATQPLSFQSVGCIFRNPRGLTAGDLIEQAGLKGTRSGNAEISDRHANFIVTEEGSKAADVLNLIDIAKSRVAEEFGVELELEIQIW